MKKLTALLLTLIFLAGCSALPDSIESTPEPVASSSSEPASSVSEPESISSEPESATNSTQETLYDVVRVVDGDTFIIDCNGTEERVRLLLIDTPESVHPDADRNVPYGEVASDFTKAYLDGKQVSLEFDVQERDRCGRLLA